MNLLKACYVVAVAKGILFLRFSYFAYKIRVKFLLQLFDVFYFKPSNRKINPLNSGRLDLSRFDARGEMEGRLCFHTVKEFGVLADNVNVKAHRFAFIDITRTEHITLSYCTEKCINMFMGCLIL